VNRVVRSLRSGGLARQVAEQAMANIAIQALGAITTLSFVHLLPTHEYAAFGLSISTVNFIAVASDLGLMASMQYFWRSDRGNDALFADRYAAIRRVRMMLFSATSLIGVATLGWLLYHQGFGAPRAALNMALVLALAWVQITSAMIVLPLRLNGDLRRAYSIELIAAVIRAALAVLAFVLLLQRAWFPLISLGISGAVVLLLARKHLPAKARTHQRASGDAIRAVFRYIIPTTPASIVFATQDLFVYWLATLGGGAIVVAQAFALGRLAAIFVTLGSIMSNVIIPRVVNLADDSHAYRNGIIPVVLMALFCAAMTGFAGLFPDVALFVLGGKFRGLGTELMLSLGAASFALVAVMLGQISRAMGWIRWETPMTLVHVAAALALAPLFNFRTTAGVLSFNLVLAMLSVTEWAFIHFLGLRRMRAIRAGGKSA